MGLDLGSITNLALAGTSSASQIFATSSNADERAALSRYQAQSAANEATINRQNAVEAAATGRAAEQRVRLRTNQEVGQQRAQAGASGFDVGSETLVDNFAATAMTGEVDALGVRDSAQRQVNAYLRQATADDNQATFYRTEADDAEARGNRSSGNSLLTSVGSVAGSWYGLGGGL